MKIRKNKFKIGRILFICFLTYLASNTISKTYDNIKLARDGIRVKGIVIDKRVVGGKGTNELDVRYLIQKNYYHGTINNEKWNLNDSVELVCLLSDPTIVRSYDFIKTNYSWFDRK